MPGCLMAFQLGQKPQRASGIGAVVLHDEHIRHASPSGHRLHRLGKGLGARQGHQTVAQHARQILLQPPRLFDLARDHRHGRALLRYRFEPRCRFGKA